jgi:hypothetical protein
VPTRRTTRAPCSAAATSGPRPAAGQRGRVRIPPSPSAGVHPRPGKRRRSAYPVQPDSAPIEQGCQPVVSGVHGAFTRRSHPPTAIAAPPCVSRTHLSACCQRHVGVARRVAAVAPASPV